MIVSFFYNTFNYDLSFIVVLSMSHYVRCGSYCYKLKSLKLDKRKNLVLGLTQENSIENSVQDCLPYIQVPNGPCKLFLAYPKWLCVSHIIWHHLFQNVLCSSIHHVTCDCVIWCDLLCDSMILSITLTLSSKNRKNKNKWKWKWKWKWK